jgi:hypothetical protein
MTLYTRNQLHLLWIFYKSTLYLNVVCSVLLGVINFPNVVLPFGICFASGGTVISLLYKEITRTNEYYFYYNKGLPRWVLLCTCAALNLAIGMSLIILAGYGKHS